MAPAKEIGECLITLGEDDYFFRPSFANMMQIGDPQEIVQVFYDLHNDEQSSLVRRSVTAFGGIPAWLASYLSRPQSSKQAVYAAMNVLTACCEEDISTYQHIDWRAETGKVRQVAIRLPERFDASH